MEWRLLTRSDMSSCRAVSAALSVVLLGASCGGRIGALTLARDAAPPSPEQLAQLWVDPGRQPRDLFWGVGGERLAPPPGDAYRLDARDDSGFSISYDVTSADGTSWSAKIGTEAQSEVVMSRLLWGLGYHQPPIYYLPSWIVSSGGRQERESEARFRPKLARLDREPGYWRWADNPFLGAREFRGLLVVLLMLNSTDLKDDNNAIYQVADEWEGATRWFLVRDLGAALGETGKLYPRRNWLEGFEQSGFITRATRDRVEFDYRGRHRELLSMITPGDVRWAAERMSRLTDRQWHDAFRAANYDPAIAERYIRRIKAKIAEGLAVRTAAPAGAA
jgi:hypothetical protein